MDGYNKAKTLLEENRDALERLAQGLLDSETVGFKEMKALIINDTSNDKNVPTDVDVNRSDKTKKNEPADKSDEGGLFPGGMLDPTPA